MQGSLCLKNGVLYVGRHVLRGEVRTYDLDGRRLAGGLEFDALEGGTQATVSGLAVDDDHRIWVADTAARRVRGFSLHGLELGALAGPRAAAEEDAPGQGGAVADVAHVAGTEDEALFCVASRGARRHGLQLFATDGALVLSLRPLGDPRAKFRGVEGVAADERWIHACEPRAGRVQVFRDRDFHCLIQVPAAGGTFEPAAAAPVGDGRVVVATRGESSALLLVGGSGELERVLAPAGRGHGEVFEPGDVVVEPGPDDRHARVAVIDCDADRVQVFNLEGRCYGCFEDLPHTGA